MAAPTPHNDARPGDIASSVLLPGDPRRARAIAERFLVDAHCYSEVRAMAGFTGTYKGMRVSVQGTGMGMPSASIYVTELFRFYGVRTAIRVGSCGALIDGIELRDLVLAIGAHTNSNMNRRVLGDIDFAATASFDLLRTAHDVAIARSFRSHVGTVYTSDTFYDDDSDTIDRLCRHGTIAVEMETAALYRIAAGGGARALTIATVSDHLITKAELPAIERQEGFMAMAEVALETLVAVAS